MFIYQIRLDKKNLFVGSTKRTIIRKRFGHRVCAKNVATYCSLYKKIRQLEIEPTSINLEILEVISEDNLDTRLNYWKNKMKPNLNECRAGLFIDGDMVIKKRNMTCICNRVDRVVEGKPFVVSFD